MIFNKNLFFPLGASVLFSLTGIIMKILYNNFDLTANIIFFFIIFFTCLNLFIYSLIKNKGLSDLKINKKEFIFSFIISGFLVFLSNIAVFESLKYIDAGIQKVVAVSELFFIVIINLIFFRNKINKKNIFSAFLILIGLLLIVGKINIGGNSSFIKGFSFALFSTIMSVLFYYIVELVHVKINSITYCFYMFLGVFFSILILLYCKKEMNVVFISAQQPKLLFALFLSSLSIFTISFPLYLESLKKVGVLISSICFAISPALTIIGSYLILGEILKINQIFGAILIISSSFINIIEWKGIYLKYKNKQKVK